MEGLFESKVSNSSSLAQQKQRTSLNCTHEACYQPSCRGLNSNQYSRLGLALPQLTHFTTFLLLEASSNVKDLVGRVVSAIFFSIWIFSPNVLGHPDNY